ncbi:MULTISPECIES: LacI family DNA-binding transcriptional regulator [unclassified Bacillus (in: firmicutes)]|uniref:LacI family DNA-binding transcriptional regulator n=1 Tax=unclassified Bacillus (in: firmicutes) TaxID=185979 RepID=UPI0008E6E43F|nr:MULTISPECIES: LacI family DNA-binding transcriptional regulator [unclassified Bacillus (in: firmicutes)]SFA90071.1 DNA-binding transcriptional regulator, LacI/PurR family [Bacillus sp. UNCCL13]SFQ85131.1 DNA-binding transcriptional regulator, LacI/PurR family [Bacillus sp. cl95]
MSNIRDIARLANVSVATVSRVLNDHPYVREDKREAVLKAMEELNYQININAVHLAKGKTDIIGVVIPYINHPYFSTILEGIAEEAQKSGLKLMIIQTDYTAEKELEALDMLKLKQVDSLIITSRSIDLEVVQDYLAYGKIVLFEEIGDERFSSVFINHYEAFQEGMKLLIDSGHRQIGYCVGRHKGTSSSKRKQAYQDALKEVGVEVSEEWTFGECLFLEDGKKVIEKMQSLDSQPTALIVTNDMVAAGVFLEAQRAGLTYLAILGFENHPISEALGISTISLPLKEMGRMALRFSTTNEETNTNKELSYEVIRRNTV